MTKQVYLFLTLLFFCFQAPVAYSQGWAKKYSPDHEMRISHAFQRQDNSYWVWGGNNTTNGSTRLMRISPEGNVLQVFHYDTLTGIGNSIMTRDEGLAICGAGAYDYDLPNQRKRTVIRIDHNGKQLWRKDIYEHYDLDNTMGLNNLSIDTTLDNGFICGLNVRNSAQEELFLLKRLDENGNIVWERNYSDIAPKTYATNIKSTKDGGFIVQCGTSGNSEPDGYLFKVNSNGDFVWEYVPSFPTDWVNFELLEDNTILVQGNDSREGRSSVAYVGKLNSEGVELWTQEYPPLPESSVVTSFIRAGDSIAAITFSDQTSQTNKRLGFVTLDTLGNILSHTYLPTSIFGFDRKIFPFSFIKTADKGYLLCASRHADFLHKDEEGFLIKMDSTGRVFSNSISGHVFYDRNEDCNVSLNEEFLQNAIISFTSATDTFRTVTQGSGDYFLWADPGTYTVDIKLIAPYWQQVPCNPQQIVLNESSDTTFLFGLYTAEVKMPYLTMNGHAQARICAEGNNAYVLKYCNEGTEPFKGLIAIHLDERMQVDSTSVPLMGSQGSYYLVLADNPLAFSACGEVKIYFSLPCEIKSMGSSVCVEAFALPDKVFSTSAIWDKSNLEVHVEANDTKDSVLFSVTNKGTGAMSVFKDLEIIEDETIRKIQPLQLNAGESYHYKVEANGSTWRATISQTEGNPNSAFSTDAIEGVGENSSGSISKGFMSKFPLYGDYAFRNVACATITGSYDPNQKTAFPSGAGKEKIVKANTPLEYLLEFQNTGNAPAYIVRLVDTLSSYLDPVMVIAGASSHPYTFHYLDKNVIEFLFEAINLPDSTSDEPGSHGFVRFKINQKPDNETGTIIDNQVAIYFDYNPPVITNTTRVQIGTYKVDIITGIKNNLESVNNSSAFPNPFSDYTIIRVEGANFKDMDLVIYDSKGIQVHQQRISNTNEFIIRNLSDNNGIYFYKIRSGDVLVGQGKLIRTR